MDQVYNQIARDFSRTRYKVWERVATFLDSLHPSTRLLEVGCGNGKNLLYRQDLQQTKGLDISEEFIAICRERGLTVEYGNITDIPEPSNAYSAVLAIAVIHHLSTREERQKALQELIRVLEPNGEALVSVWSIHQPPTERRQFNSADEMVPFQTPTGTAYRYYHLYTSLELQEDLEVARNSQTHKLAWSVTNERGNVYAWIKKY